MSFFVVGCVVIFFALAGLAFDGGGKVHEEEQADAVAREAARAACEQIDQAAVLHGVYRLDPGYAKQAAHDYVSSAQMTTLQVTVVAPDVCKVRVSADYKTQLLGLIGVSDLPVSGSGQARFVYGVNGPEG
ncbi:pilus assembly protein TadG-related protein [Streptacidiphilus jiangxiensis]|uniref:pilus assembly protein TadG-related protein n=1 Tax=Streptacidiphilus jiangxiensis TaxID=235985 RepID=UPI000A87D44D|nr:pilus assembly protein TadG-related protein [Streptacidiphilus jiangxiensis]